MALFVASGPISCKRNLAVAFVHIIACNADCREGELSLRLLSARVISRDIGRHNEYYCVHEAQRLLVTRSMVPQSICWLHREMVTSLDFMWRCIALLAIILPPVRGFVHRQWREDVCRSVRKSRPFFLDRRNQPTVCVVLEEYHFRAKPQHRFTFVQQTKAMRRKHHMYKNNRGINLEGYPTRLIIITWIIVQSNRPQQYRLRLVISRPHKINAWMSFFLCTHP